MVTEYGVGYASDIPPADFKVDELVNDGARPASWKYINDYDKDNPVYWAEEHDVAYQEVDKIVVHHTVSVCNIEGINRSHKSWVNPTHGMNTSSQGYDIRYHEIVFKDWTSQVFRNDNELWRWTRTNNEGSYHIALCGNFDVEEPTEQQYSKLASIINQKREIYGNVPVHVHWEMEGEHTSCAGEHFHLEDIFPAQENTTVVYKHDGDIKIEENKKPVVNDLSGCPEKEWYKCSFYIDWETSFLSTYYSPQEWQSRYFHGSYKNDVGINGNWTNASWRPYLEDHKYTHGACGYNMKGKTIRIEGRSDRFWDFVCVDRWSAIAWNEVDIWFGIWEDALDRIDGKNPEVERVWRPWTGWVYEKL